MNLLEYLKNNDEEIKAGVGVDIGYKRANFIDAKIASGSRLIVNGSNNGHNYGEVGTEIKLNSRFPNSLTSNLTGTRAVSSLTPGGNSIHLINLDIVKSSTLEYLNERVKDLNAQKKKLNESIKEAKSKIDFMKANGLEEFNDDEFKVFQILNAIDENTSALEKSKIIAKIVRG